MRQWRSVVSLLLLVLGLGFLALYAGTHESEDLAAIRHLYDEDIAAHRAGDPDRAAALYTEDAIWLPPSGPLVQGRDALRERYRRNLEANVVEFTVHSEETRVCGDWAYDRGTTVGTVTPMDGGAPRPIHDKFIAIFHKVPGAGWRIARLMWSPL